MSDAAPVAARPVFGDAAADAVRLEGWWVDGFGALRDVEVGGLSPGLTVLLGPNEAGKTTHLTFLRYVLFGFPKRTTSLPQYDPVCGGRHGGRVSLRRGAEPYEVRRYRDDKAPQVVGPDGAEAGEVVLAGLVGHADAALFRSVFAFGLSELQSLASLTEEGVRQRIFSAGVSGAGRSAREVSRQLTRQLDELLRGTRGKAIINELLREIEARQADLAAATAEAAGYGRRVAEEHEALLAVEAAQVRLEAERAARARLVALRELWPRWREAHEAELELERLPVVDAETVTALRGLAGELGARRERLRRRDDLSAEALEAGRAVSAALAELGPSWDEERVRAIDPSVVGRDEVRTWGARLVAAGEAAAEARRAEATAEQRTTELRADVEQRACHIPGSPPLPLVEIEAREVQLARLREERAALRAAAAGAAAPTPRLLFVVAAALAALCVALAVVGATRDEAAGPWFAAAAVAAALAVALIGAFAVGARRGASPDLEASRERAGECARRLGLPAEAPAAEIDGLESALRAERTMRVEYDGLRRELDAAEGALRRATMALEQRRAEREAAERELATVRDGWQAFKAERGLPATLSVEGVAEWMAALDRCRAELDRRETAAARVAALEAESREWETKARAQLAAAGREIAGLDAAGLEEAVTEACAVAERRAELERLGREAERDLRVRFAGDADDVRRELAAGDPELWAAGVLQVESRIAELEDERELAIREHENARRRREALETSADVPRLQAELESLQAELDEAVTCYRELGLARALVDRTLREFMRTRQPKVLATAGEAFGRVTGGRYTAVVQPEDLEDDLRVLDADGRAKSLDALSRGTAEQLYLCLRLGLAHEFAARSVALPFVMDDCLVDFDPARAAATADLLVEFAIANQVLVFTCHPATAALLEEASGGTAAVVRL